MVYKSVFAFYSEIPIHNGKNKFLNSEIIIDELLLPFETDDNNHIKSITIIVDKADDIIENIYFYTLDFAELFISQMSLIGYCKVQLIRHIITTHYECDFKESFGVLSKDIFH